MALGLGSIAFTGFNADGDDNIAFVALEEIAAGTVITFTDNEWTGTAFNTGESVFTWTATAIIAAGSIITIDTINSPAPTSNLGSVAYTDATNTGISNSNEILYAYTGTAAAPVFLTAVANDGLTNDASLDGTGLIDGTNAIDLGTVDPDADIGAYTAPRNGQDSFADYAAIINDAANWTVQDAGGDQGSDGIAPDLPFSTDVFTLGGVEAQVVGFAAGSLSVNEVEGDSGSVVYSFTVTRSGGTTGAVDVSGTVSTTGADAADFGGTLPTAFSTTIAAGETSATVTVTVSGDTGIEENESFTLTITAAENDADVPTTLGSATAQGIIQNDDAGLSLGGIAVYEAAPSLAGSVATPEGSDDLILVRLGAFTGSGATAAGRAESVSFDTATGRIFVTNAAQSRIDIAQVGADGGTTAAGGIELAGLTGYGGVNSVAVQNGIVAVAYQNSVADQPGYVALFDTATGTLRSLVEVGVLPDQLTFSPDGTKILVANEGETVSPANNPPGSVSIIDVSGGAAAAAVGNTISFAALTGSEAILAERGLALFPGQSAGADIEPEYISVSPDGTRAYVTLQEVNGVAVIDLTDPAATQPIAIQPLGFVDRSLDGNEFDPSDRDGIDLINADVLSLPQPDAIASFAVGGATYFVTANEGDARVGGLSDETRLSSASYVLDPTAYPDAAALKADAELGRLNVLTNIGDIDGDGDYDQIYTFGGRGISIFRQDADGTITKVRETGGEFESIIARDFPQLFNVENNASPDNRSDNKGPEPEGVTVGQVGDRLYAFVTLERVGGVMVYDVTDPATASFVTFRPATAADFAPETVEFVAAADNPTGAALLLSANEVSGTTTLYRVVAQTENADVITGAADADVFNGKGGDDVIRGEGGRDVIEGGAGNDLLTGGADGDVFLFDSAADTGRDRITDFGATDLLVTTVALFDSNRNGVITFGEDRALDLAGGGEVAITGGNGRLIERLEFDGVVENDGVTYYVYSQVGSAAGAADVVFG